MKTHRLLAALCGLALCAGIVPAWGQNYPARPIRVVVPTTAGGASDIMMRLIAQKVGEKVGQSVIVDNRPGAGNVIGTDIVAKSSPDGYTLLLTYTDHVFNPFLHPKLPGYDAAIWYCMLAPAGVPKPVLATLNAEIHRALALADVREKLIGQGVEISAGSPAELASQIDRELAKWGKVIKASGVKL